VGLAKKRNRKFYLNRNARSTLTLFVTGVGTDDPHHALAADDFAVTTDSLDRSQNFHWISPEKNLLKLPGERHFPIEFKIVLRPLHRNFVTRFDANESTLTPIKHLEQHARFPALQGSVHSEDREPTLPRLQILPTHN